ncbi:hypothetical protein ACQKC8_18055 [Stutzerimonas stutzeri]|uniref:hypothetical protein n=1 Tax=Stutzerimonas stutzeri TaxID=316 RepID=UPI003C2FD0A2
MTEITEHVGIRSTVTGDLKAVSARLNAEKAAQVVAITADNASDETLAALGEALEVAARLMTAAMLKPQQMTVEQLVSLLLKAPVRPAVLKQTQMLAKAKRALLDSGDWLFAQDIAVLAEVASTNPTSRTSRWKREGRIFAICHNGYNYFPLYALAKASGYRPLPVMGEVLKVFDGQKDG